MKNRRYKYPKSFRMPIVIYGIVWLSTSCFFIFLLLKQYMGITFGDRVGLNVRGLFVALMVGMPIFLGIFVLVVKTFPDIEINGNKFRLVTFLGASSWISIDHVLDMNAHKLSRLGCVCMVEVSELPRVYRLIGRFHQGDYPCFFIHPKIDAYASLKHFFNRSHI